MKELNLEQMENIEGGISAAAYCATVQMIYSNNEDQQETEGMGIARGICSFYGHPVG